MLESWWTNLQSMVSKFLLALALVVARQIDELGSWIYVECWATPRKIKTQKKLGIDELVAQSTWDPCSHPWRCAGDKYYTRIRQHTQHYLVDRQQEEEKQSWYSNKGFTTCHSDESQNACNLQICLSDNRKLAIDCQSAKPDLKHDYRGVIPGMHRALP